MPELQPVISVAQLFEGARAFAAMTIPDLGIDTDRAIQAIEEGKQGHAKD